MQYEDIQQIIFPKGQLQKKYDTVLLTGEVFRSKTNKKHLGATDKSFDVSLKLSPESFKTLKGIKLDSVDKNGNVITAGNRKLTGLKKVDLKVKVLDDEGNPTKDEQGNFVFELDEMDEPVKKFSHYQITLRQNAKIGDKEVILPVTMVDGTKVTDILAEGSKVTILGQAYETIFRDQPAMGLNLKEVKIHELITLEGGGEPEDPFAALGMSSSAKDFEQEVQDEGEPEKVAVPQSSPVSQPEPPIDFDDSEIPF